MFLVRFFDHWDEPMVKKYNMKNTEGCCRVRTSQIYTYNTHSLSWDSASLTDLLWSTGGDSWKRRWLVEGFKLKLIRGDHDHGAFVNSDFRLSIFVFFIVWV